MAPHPHWPLFDLVVRSPRLEIRLAREHEFVELTELVDAGIHDPATMPFSHPWTDEPLPERHRNSYQWWWRQRAEWGPDAWAFDGAVLHEGHIIGVQSLMAKQFAALRAVSTGSWLGRVHHGQGYGREMRAAILHLAFEGLGADVAYSGAFFDNAASLNTSRSLGYRENGREVHLRRGEPTEIVNLRLDRSDWQARERPPCTIDGLSSCLEMFGISAEKHRQGP
jgi:RimJ/RimL family protein N-acetyltransferase